MTVFFRFLGKPNNPILFSFTRSCKDDLFKRGEKNVKIQDVSTIPPLSPSVT